MSDDTPRDWHKTYALGLDLGQAKDWTALCLDHLVIRSDGKLDHHILGLERWRGERYPHLVRIVRDRVTTLVQSVKPCPAYERRYYPDNRPRVLLVIDYTGPGRPVLDMFLEANLEAEIIGVTITGGAEVTRGDDGSYRTPKRDLASTLQIVQQAERFQLSRKLKLAETLITEADNFKAKISLAGHDSYGAAMDWRDTDASHDDLVLSVALACWAGEAGIAHGGFEAVPEELRAQLAVMGV